MEYVREPVGLFLSRADLLEKDLLEIIQTGDFSSFPAFKEYWRRDNLSMLHLSINEKEDKTEFYHALYAILTRIIYIEFMNIDTDTALRSFYILFTVFCTQIKKPVLIPITPFTINILVNLSNCSTVAKDMLGELVKRKAFAIGVAEGVKTFIPFRKNVKDSVPLIDRGIQVDLEVKIASGIEFDVDKAHSLSMKYLASKQRLKERLLDNEGIFESASYPNNKFAESFKLANIHLLNISNPTFPLSIASRLRVIHDNTKNYQNRNHRSNLKDF